MTRYQLATLAITLSLCLAARVWAGEVPEEPAYKVDAALQSELAGDDIARGRLLSVALAENPAQEHARWQNGQVQTPSGEWIDFHQAVEELESETQDYRKQREALDLQSVASLMTLADWCRDHGLLDQERAHLGQVLALDADHAAARERLGHVRIEGLWITPEAVRAAESRRVALEESLNQWGPVIQEALQQLQGTPYQREQGRQTLSDITDPSAIPAMQQALRADREESGLLLVQWLSRLKGYESSQALARTAIRSPHRSVQRAAADALKERPFDHFVPVLLGAMRTPVKLRTQIGINEQGWYTLETLLEADAQNEHRQLHQSTQVARQVVIRQGLGLKQSADLGDHLAAQRVLLQRMRSLDQQRLNGNDRIRRTDNRAELVLRTVSSQHQLKDPDDWWDWWIAYNDLHFDGVKPSLRVNKDPERVYIVDRGKRITRTPPPPSLLNLKGNPLGTSCFAAGTPVWTERGAMPIEQIEIGDRVLSQDVDSGELAYKVVLRTTIRPPVQTYRISTDSLSFRGSGGHPLWVNGRRWMFLRDVEPGMRLHGTGGSAPVLQTASADEVPAYNLVVADFHTYFLGDAQVLCHDNSPREPTNALVPGLLHAPENDSP